MDEAVDYDKVEEIIQILLEALTESDTNLRLNAA